MENDILEQLSQIFAMLNNPATTVEDRMKSELFLNELLQNANSVFLFIQILFNESNPEYADFYAFAAVNIWQKKFWDSITKEERNNIISKLEPLIFHSKKVASLIRGLFYSLIHDSYYLPVWNDIFLQCKNELSTENPSIEKVDIIIQNIFNLSKLIKRATVSKPVEPDFLTQFNEITASFFNLDLLSTTVGMSITINSIRTIDNLFGRSFSTSSNELVDLRIYEICNFLLTIFRNFMTIELSIDQLKFLTLASSEIYELLSFINCRMYYPSTQVLVQICNEWRPAMLDSVFNMCLKIFKQEKNEHFRIGKIIRPLTFSEQGNFLPVTNIETFFISALEFLSIPNEDIGDFIYNPGLFYTCQYSTSNDMFGNLRNNTVLIYKAIFENLNSEQITKLFQNVIQTNEVCAFLTAKNAKTIIEKGCKNLLFQYIHSILANFFQNEFNPIYLTTIIYLFSKCIKIIPLNYIAQFVHFSLTLLEKFKATKSMDAIVIVGVHFLYKLKKRLDECCEQSPDGCNVTWNDNVVSMDDIKTVFPDGAVIEILFKLVESHITSDIFSLIEIIADEHEEVHPLLINIYEPLLNNILNELSSYQKGDSELLLDRCNLSLTSMFSLLITIISKHGDSGIEELLFKVLITSLKMSNVFDICEQVFECIIFVFKSNSKMSEFYLRKILALINLEDEEVDEKLDFRKFVLYYSTPFLIFMSNFPNVFINSDLLLLTFKTLIKLMNEGVINDCYDNFGLTVILTWIFQLQPQIISPMAIDQQPSYIENNNESINPSFFISYLEGQKKFVKNAMTEAAYESSMMNLILTFALLEKITLTPDILQRWLVYIGNHEFIRKVDIQFHMLALRFFIKQGAFAINGNNENEIANMAVGFMQQMETKPDAFLTKVVCQVKDFIDMLNIHFPIMQILQQ